MSTQADNRALLRTLGIHKPIIQAPMAGVTTPALAAAVSNAGGLGSLGVAAMNAENARRAIHQTRELTTRPFNVNVFCHRPATPDAAVERAWLAWLEPVFRQYGATPPQALSEIYTSFVVDTAMQAMLLAEKPAVVSFHFGLPPDAVIAQLKHAGIRLLASATNLDEAAAAVEAGVDAIVAQGIEAGGHRGIFDTTSRDERLGTFALTRLLASEFDLPVIAAGGIMDGAGIAAALALGAQAGANGHGLRRMPGNLDRRRLSQRVAQRCGALDDIHFGHFGAPRAQHRQSLHGARRGPAGPANAFLSDHLRRRQGAQCCRQSQG
ncbi:NAD(P)H-dependent flavin oxidoreductase YrpB (nitropropane dioxygenase family) [Paraburkholderia sp. JPY419]